MRRKIGLIGGVSPESTLEYYEYIMRKYYQMHENLYLPEVIIYSVRFQQLCDLTDSGRWDKTAEELVNVGNRLVAAGAEGLLICANTLHLVIEEFRAGVKVPVISMLDVVGNHIEGLGFKKVGLLGTMYTMTQPFYREALAGRGIEAIIPEGKERISEIIYDELAKGRILDDSREFYLAEMDKLMSRGAEGIILGCTEIPLLVKPEHTDLPLINTTELHADAALKFALGE
jgi:aspartate racemase